MKINLITPTKFKALASWYGHPFHGRIMASGKVYNMHQPLAAHKTLPLGSKILIRNPKTGVSLELEIKDRGPIYSGSRI